MTGNVTVRGGGIGSLAPVDGMAMKLGKAPAMCSSKKFNALLFSQYMQSRVITTGRDSRTPEQIRADVLGINGIDLGPDAKIEIDMVWRGGGSADPFNQRSSINPKILAWKKLDFVLSYERFMSTTARYSDLVLPVITHLEESFFTGSRVKTDMNVVNAVVSPMYEAKSDVAINEMIAKRLGLDWGRHGMTDLDVMRVQWKTAKLPEAYKQVDPEMKLPSFEEMLEKANLQLPVPPEKSVIAAAKFKPGEFPTDTGRINFYSPWLAVRGRVQGGIARAQYVRPADGYEDIMEKTPHASGRTYTLQYTTPHMPNRSHSSFDNTTMIQDVFPHAVTIHPDDAKARGIRDGAPVYVYTEAGCIKIPAKVTLRQLPGVVSIGEGAWYQPSKTEFFDAYFDEDGSGKVKRHRVPVDVGGAVNTLTIDRDIGAGDPYLHLQTTKSGGL